MKRNLHRVSTAVGSLPVPSKTLSSFFVLVFCLLVSVGAWGQSSANYAFATNATAALNLDLNGNTVDMTTGTTQVSTSSVDQGVGASAISIGFDLFLMGNRYTQFNVTTNGLVSLSSTSTSASGSTYLVSGGTVTTPIISAFAADLGTGTSGKTHYKLVGTAPNRALVIEFNNMTLYWTTSYTNDGTYQVRLYESSGVVEFVYGSMSITSSASGSDVTTGIGFATNTTTNNLVYVTSSSNTSSVTSPFTDNPTYANGTITNLHSPTEGSRRVYRFSPPVPSAPTGLNFTGVTGTSMTLNWTDNASNELGYAIYRSTDNVTFTYQTTTAANAVSYAATGLFFGTTYYWKVYALTEGAFSSALSGSQMTNLGSVSGNKTVGGGGSPDYATLTAAFSDINTNGLGGAVNLILQSGYNPASETYPLVPNTTPITSATNTITIYPAVTGLSITSANTTATFNFNNSDYVTIDGRVNAMGTTKDLIVENTATGGVVAQFINDATNNTLKYCLIKGVTSSTTSGVLLFSTTTGTTGNDNNTIDNNDIRDGATTPSNGVYSAGTTTLAAQNNSNNTISNNNIFNFYNSSSITNGGVGVNISSGTTDWTINGNSFYQTSTRTTFGAGATVNGILLSNGSGNNFLVSGNFIGGTAASCGSTAWTINAATTVIFRGIQASVGSTTATSIQGNTIQNLSITTTSASTAQSLISLVTGAFNCGTITANTLGSQSVTGSVTFSTSGAAAIFSGILAGTGTPATISISNNTIGGITVTGAGTTSTRGISFQGLATSYTISGNTIGSASTANSISNSTNSTVYGIFGSATSGSVSITNNTVVNLATTGTSTSNQMVGILTQSGISSTTVSNNTVQKLSSSSTSTGSSASASVIGISQNSTTAPVIVSQNTIHTLSNSTATVTAIAITGMYYSGPTSGTNIIARNNIHSLSNVATSATAELRGIQFAAGLATVQNNMIRLGINASGTALTTGIVITGLYDVTSTAGTAMLHNSVYIGGSGVSTLAGNSYAFRSDQTGNVRTYQNNIFVNARSNATTGGKHYATKVSGTGRNPTGLSSNYNIYNATGTGGVFGLYNALDVANMITWRDSLGNDGSSGVGDPNFVNATGDATAVDLHVTGTTPAEASGNVANTVSDDFDGTTRSGASPVDIGADAGSFTPSDIFPPAVSYTAISNRSATNTALTSFATITDNVGVSTGANLPRLYYKKSTDANAFVGNTSGDNGWKFVTATNAVSPFSFTLDYSIINGGSVAAGNVIQYFVAAQDDANNLGSKTLMAGASANPPVQNINDAPGAPGGALVVNIDKFTILNGVGGAVNVGTGQTYTSLTLANGLFATINAGVLTGNVTANITSDLTGETGVNSLNQWSEEGVGGYTLTIQSDGTARTISGTAVATGTPMVNINGADRVTISGGTGGQRLLTFRNTLATAANTGATLQFTNSSTSATVNNCIFENNSTSTSRGNITIGSTGTNNVTLNNNDIRDATAGTTGLQAVGVYSSSATNTVTVSNNNVFNFSNTGILLTSVADACSISGNNLYSTVTSTSTAQTGISISAGNNHMVTDNYIGGSAAACGGSAWTNNAAVTFNGISLSTGTTTTTSVQNNTIQNINLTSASTATFTGINITAGLINVGTIIGNTIGHTSTANSVQVAGNSTTTGINSATSNAVSISNNTVSNLTATGTGSSVQVIGIKFSSSSAPTINTNTIKNLSTASTKSSDILSVIATNATFAVIGIVSTASATNQIISANTISGLQATTSSSSANPAVVGIGVDASGSTGSVSRNRIYNLTNTATNTTTYPGIAGIRTYYGLWTVSNNQIAITNGANTNGVNLYGILEGAESFNYYYNSVYLGGSPSTGAGISAAWNNYYSAATPTLRNNLLYNARTNTGTATGNHYAISQSSVPSTFSSDYNLLVAASASTIGFKTSAQTFSGWKTAISGDTYSHADLNTNATATNLFNDQPNGDLNIKTANIEAWYVAGKGVQIAGLSADYGDVAAGRPVTVPAGATDIGSDEIGTPGVAPQTATASAAPAPSTTTTYSFAGRTLTSITWGAGGTVPTTITLKYYSGETPPDPTCANPSALYADAYWDISPTGGSGYTFDMTLNYTPAILGTIAAEADCILSENEVNCWRHYPTSTRDLTAKTVTKTGLLDFSRWTISSILSPLPIELSSFRAYATGASNMVEWATASEVNASQFVVERSADGIAFGTLGTVAAKGAIGLPSSYDFEDVKPSRVSYYRLRMEDLDGTFQYSPVVVVTRKSGDFGILTAYPSPTVDWVKVDFETTEESEVILQVTDLTGRIALQMNIEADKGINTASLDLGSLPAGVYQINARSNGLVSRPYRVVKQ